MNQLLAASRTLRSRRMGIAICCTALLSCWGAAALLADQPAKPSDVGRRQNQQGRQVSLYDQLRIGLKAVTNSDKQFIDLVVLRVNQGKLPRSLVDSTFLWARYRYRTRPGSYRLRPMVYFRPALVLRARRIGVVL